MLDDIYERINARYEGSTLPPDRIRLLEGRIDYQKRIKKISIIIATRERKDALRSYAIEGLRHLDFDADRYEVVIVDNNENDETYEYLKSLDIPNLKVVREPREGICYARNSGIKEAKGDILVFIDDDCQVDQDWLKRVDEYYSKPDDRYLLGQGYIYDECYKKILNRENQQRVEMNFAAGNLSCRREVFDFVSFNEGIIFGWDEYDLIGQIRTFWPNFRYFLDKTPIRHFRAGNKYFIDRKRSEKSPNGGFSREGIRVTRKSRAVWRVNEKVLKRNLDVNSPNFKILFLIKESLYSLVEIPLLSYDLKNLIKIKLMAYGQLMSIRSMGGGR